MSINLQAIYLSFIGPLFEYKDIIWDNIQNYLNERLENVQVGATRIVTSGTNLSSKNELYDGQDGSYYQKDVKT